MSSSEENVPLIVEACRRGILYEKLGQFESAVITAWDEPQALEIIQSFRGHIYAMDGESAAVVNGKNLHPSDVRSYHVVEISDSALVGCARYERLFRPGYRSWVELGGFAISPARRGTRLVFNILSKIKELAALFGDTRFFAHASVQYGSSTILQKMGAKRIASYYHPDYKRDVDVVVILLGEGSSVAVGDRVRVKASKEEGSARILDGLTGEVISVHPIADGWFKVRLDPNTVTPHEIWPLAALAIEKI